MPKEPIFLGDSADWASSYSPAVAVSAGKILFISGQVALDLDGNAVGRGDVVAQARKIFENIGVILKKAGADFGNIVKTNYYITDASEFSKVASLRSEYFKGVFPASTMVEIKGLVHKDLMLEIEAIAVVS